MRDYSHIKSQLHLHYNKVLSSNISLREVIFSVTALICASSWPSPAVALLLGIFIAQAVGHPYSHLNHKATNILLQVSVVGLGFGMNVNSAIHAGSEGFIFTVFSILGTLALGYLLSKLLKIEKRTSFLIAAGTAICGGSAIAAVSPVIKAREKHISIALGTVFILNSVALFIFPPIGHWLHLTQEQFGLWTAIAIHDTSSVVGAASKYGNIALETATTIKLARALWIIPVSIGAALIFKNKSTKLKFPYFIILFVIAMVLNTYLPSLATVSHYIVSLSKNGLTLTLFLIGSGLNKSILQAVGIRPLLQGVILWIFIASLTLIAIIWT